MGLKRREDDVHSVRTGKLRGRGGTGVGPGAKALQERNSMSKSNLVGMSGVSMGPSEWSIGHDMRSTETAPGTHLSLCARCCAGSFTFTIDSSHQPSEGGTIFPSFYRLENQGTERVGQFHTVTQRVSDRAGIRTQLLNHHPF